MVPTDWVNRNPIQRLNHRTNALTYQRRESLLAIMKHVVRIAVLIAAVWAGACSENLDPKTPDGALHAFRDALESRNYELMVKFCSKPTRIALRSSVELLKEQAEGFKRYPPEYRIGALGIYPRSILNAKTSASLLAAYLQARLEKYPPRLAHVSV